MHKIVLFYKYLDIQDPENEMKEQRKICQSLNLKGRLIIASEGLNGTFEGEPENISKYCQYLRAKKGYEDIHLKFSEGTGKSFPKLSIKVRKEIVSAHLGSKDLNPTQITGKYITAQQLHEWIHSDKEFYIVDMRNDYEHSVGHFAGSILPAFSNFRDLDKILPQIEHLKDKTVVTVCTGGVRCEKASGFLVNNDFRDVYQLFGGIVTYMEQFPNQDFKGKLYVFDQRVTMGFNTEDPKHEMIGKCKKCGSLSEGFVNCTFNECHKHFICCNNCRDGENIAYCDDECRELDLRKIESMNFALSLNNTYIDLYNALTKS